MSDLHAPFRFDYVGSFLRPSRLMDARRAFEAKNITRGELTEIEDECIRELVGKQKAAGYHDLTDGEFRRAWWHMDFFWGLGGIEYRQSAEGLHFHDATTRAQTAVITGKINGDNHPFVKHYQFVHAFEDAKSIAKQTMPAPTQLLVQLRLPEFLDANKAIYPDDDELKADIVKAYKQVMADLYAQGCRTIQFDDCTWTLYADRKIWKFFGIDEQKLQHIAAEEIELNNAVIDGKAEDLVVNTHVCRGNFRSTYASEGPYDPIAPYLFALEHVDAFYLEYDDARSGSFEPLKYIPDGKKVVLGLITTKHPALEDKKFIIKRIHEAARYVPLENLYLSPQCGFASTEEGNKLSEDEQWAKLALVKEIAQELWG